MKNIEYKWEFVKGNVSNGVKDENFAGSIEIKNGFEIAAIWADADDVDFNASLICDAGNTYNQTQLTPSEILAQRNEAVKVLKYSLSIFSSIADTEELTEDDLVNVAIKKIQSLISKIEKK